MFIFTDTSSSRNFSPFKIVINSYHDLIGKALNKLQSFSTWETSYILFKVVVNDTYPQEIWRVLMALYYCKYHSCMLRHILDFDTGMFWRFRSRSGRDERFSCTAERRNITSVWATLRAWRPPTWAPPHQVISTQSRWLVFELFALFCVFCYLSYLADWCLNCSLVLCIVLS